MFNQEYVINFEISISDNKADYEEYGRGHSEGDYKTGKVSAVLPFIPTVGMHIGPAQLVTVCQVYYIKGEGENDHEFNVTCRTEECYDIMRSRRSFKNIEELENRIRELTGFRWGFVEQK